MALWITEFSCSNRMTFFIQLKMYYHSFNHGNPINFFYLNDKRPPGTKLSFEPIWTTFSLTTWIGSTSWESLQECISILQDYKPRFGLERLLYSLRFRPNNIFFDLQFDISVFFKIFISSRNFVFFNHSTLSISCKIQNSYTLSNNKLFVEKMRQDTSIFFNFWYLTLKSKTVNFSTYSIFIKMSVVLEIVALIIVSFGDFITPLFL